MNYKIDASVIDLARLSVRAGGGAVSYVLRRALTRARLDFMQSRITSLSVNGFSL